MCDRHSQHLSYVWVLHHETVHVADDAFNASNNILPPVQYSILYGAHQQLLSPLNNPYDQEPTTFPEDVILVALFHGEGPRPARSHRNEVTQGSPGQREDDGPPQPRTDSALPRACLASGLWLTVRAPVPTLQSADYKPGDGASRSHRD